MDVDNCFTSKYSVLYKSRIGFSRNRKSEQKQMENDRREKRWTMVNANRNLEDVETEDVMENIPPPPNETDLRKERLMKWKKIQEKVFMKNNKSVKKPFVVGIVRHKINSPLPVFSNLKKQGAVRSMRNVAKPMVTTMVKRETRAEVKKKTLLKPLSQNLGVFPFTATTTKASSVFKFEAFRAPSSKKLTEPISPLFMRREASKKVQLKQYFFPQRNNKEGKQSSDEELAVPLTSPRVTRSRQLPKIDVKRIQIVKPHQKNLPEKKIDEPALRKRELFKNVIIEEVATSGTTEVQNGPTMSSNFVLRPAQHSNMLNPSPQQQISFQDALTQDKPLNSTTFKNGPVKDVNIKEKDTSPSMEVQNGCSTPHNDFVLNTSVIVEKRKRSTQSRSMLKPSPQQKIDLQDVPTCDKAIDSPTFQKTRINNEAIRLLLLVDYWENIKQLEHLNQDIIDNIDLVVGQTKLLTNDKFQQFRFLIKQHEANHEQFKVTLDDLNGFWEMMYLEVEKLNKQYEKLAALKSNNWVEPELPVQLKRRRPRVKKTVIGEKSIIGVKTRAKQTSLIKKVLISEAKKRRSSVHDSAAAAAVVRLSLTAKDFGRLPLVNDMSTTPKSCLKMKHVDDSEMKSIRKTVLFDQNFEFEDEENQNKESTKNKRRWNNSETGCFCTPRRSTRLSVKSSVLNTSG